MSYQIKPVDRAPNHPFHGQKILSRQEATSRLCALKPGAQEHHILQNILIKMSGIVEINLPNATYKINTIPEEARLLGGFGSSEHVAIGEEVKLKELPQKVPLLMRGSVPLYFSQIIALAGDFYGVVREAISLPGGTDHISIDGIFRKMIAVIEKQVIDIFFNCFDFIVFFHHLIAVAVMG